MKSLILLAVLAALTVCNNASFSGQAVTYEELAQKDGKYNPDTYYTELIRTNYRRVGKFGVMEYLDVIQTLSNTTRITAIALSPQPPFEHASGLIYRESLGTNQAHVLMNSTLHGGFHYLLQVWGYDTLW